MALEDSFLERNTEGLPLDDRVRATILINEKRRKSAREFTPMECLKAAKNWEWFMENQIDGELREVILCQAYIRIWNQLAEERKYAQRIREGLTL